MEPIIKEIAPIKLVGIKITTSLSENNTPKLWKRFMQNYAAIRNRKNDLFYSVQNYPKGLVMDDFTPLTPFEKWAAVEVFDFENIPAEMDQLVIPEGKYAVFKHKGLASDFFRTSQHIYGTWLPQSSFQLADRPHFEVMGANYQGPKDSNSEEDVYIPLT